ncbi:MAG: ribonuclease P protein component [SAR86 cluster bacterium]|nr:ribonuclease P protein component [SAR86 cluster bacterium]
MSLSDRYTVPSNPGFSSILSKPDLKFNKGSYLVFGKKNSVKTPRLGVSIKKRDYKLATQRNMFKRKVKNSFLSCIEDLPSVDFIVMVRPGAQLNDSKTLCALWSSVEVK